MTNTTIKEQIEIMLPKCARSLGQRRRLMKTMTSCPQTGNGVHQWMYTAALKSHRDCPDKILLARLMRVATSQCGREVPEEEIDNAITNSQPIAEGKTTGSTRTPRWPRSNPERIAAITKAGPNLAELAAMSPDRRNDEARTEEIIDILFPGNPLLCAGAKKEVALTRSREEWRGFMANQQFIVPSPMSAVRGKTKSGQDSMRCLANTGQRRFAVVEFDEGTFDDHAALLIHLAQFAPLALVVHSGGKSLHSWFRCHDQPDEKIGRFFRYAVSLGADPATWTRCQFVRMPDGRRDNGKRQAVVYFNATLLKK